MSDPFTKPQKTLHIITACSRPENLAALQASITDAKVPEWNTIWHIRYDHDKNHVGGQKLKNSMLDDIPDGYVFFLDDDTLMHSDLLKRANNYEDFNALVVSQQRKTTVLEANQDNMRITGVDIGQVILKRSLIGDKRIPLTYEGDGHFLENLLKDRDDVIYLNEVLSYYNALRDESESETAEAEAVK